MWSPAALERGACHGQQDAHWELLGVRTSVCVSMDTCLNSDASLSNANRPKKGNRAVAQGEKILRGISFQSIRKGEVVEWGGSLRGGCWET